MTKLNASHPSTAPDGGPPPVCDAVDAPTRSRATIAELRDRELRVDRLWEIEDVAAFLVFSVRQTEIYVKQPGMPQPRLVAKSGARRWAPSQWLEWANDPDTWYAAGEIDTAPDAACAGLTAMGAL